MTGIWREERVPYWSDSSSDHSWRALTLFQHDCCPLILLWGGRHSSTSSLFGPPSRFFFGGGGGGRRLGLGFIHTFSFQSVININGHTSSYIIYELVFIDLL